MLEFCGQLVLATLLGALVGLEREISKKAAGMRTFALVSLGAAFFTIISIMASEKFYSGEYFFDIFRIPSQIVLGVGFLGAGLIIFHRSQLHGLTTAAGLWVAAAIGMAVGFKLYLLAVFTTFLVVLILVFFWFIEARIVKKLTSKSPPDK
jgi:putative Mg2+ transporter-C (MgtC) family protein